MPVTIEEDIAVVAVLDLEEICDERVAGERLREIALCADEFGGGRVSVRRLEVVEERDVSKAALGEAAGVLGLLDRVDGDGVGYRLDEAGGVARDEDSEAGERKFECFQI